MEQKTHKIYTQNENNEKRRTDGHIEGRTNTCKGMRMRERRGESKAEEEEGGC